MRRAQLAAILCACSTLLVVALAAAQDHQTPLDPTHGPTPPDDATLSPGERARRALVVARVNEHAITVGEVEDALASQSPYLRQRYTDPQHMHELIDNLSRFRLLADEAQRRGLARNPQVVHAVKTDAVQAMLRHEIDDRITMASIPDAEVHAYYDAHLPDEFHHPEMRRASHILVATREEADALVPQLRDADVRAFRELAMARSLDTETKLRGGDLRFFARAPRPGSDETPPDAAIVTAAFGLHEVGDVAAPVQVGTEWSVVKLTGLRPEETRRFEDAAAGIRMRLWRERRQQALEALEAQLRERFHPEVHADRVTAIRLDPLPEGAGMPGFPPGGAAGAGQAPTKQAPPAPRH